MDTSNFKEVFESPKGKELTAQVAALELEVMRLRDVIFDMAGEEPGISWGKADKVLSTPFTPTVLPELIEKVERLTIERCAAVCDVEWNGDSDTYEYSIAANDLAAAIRKLGEQE